MAEARQRYSTDGRFLLEKDRALVFVQKIDYTRFLLGVVLEGRFYEFLRGSQDDVEFTKETATENVDGKAYLINTQLNYATWFALYI